MTVAQLDRTREVKDQDFLIASLEKMLFVRAFERKAMDMSLSNPPEVDGSVHLCAGQEAVALGAIAALQDDDQVICTYRGHGWALAAGVEPKSVMAEICQKETGLNGGRAGSAYMMAPGTRFIGENSIVGAGTTIACGVAMSNLHQGNGRVVIVTIGDGALNQGSVHEAMAFAAVRDLPVIFVVENNGWSELTATDDMFRVPRLAKRAAGYGIESATVDGTDPIKVRDTVALAAAHARNGHGPSLLEFCVPRLWGHYNKDIQHYRSKDDLEAAEKIDPILLLSQAMMETGVLDAAGVEELRSSQQSAVDQLTDEVKSDRYPDPETALDHVYAPAPGHAAPTVIDEKEMSYIQAVNLALRDILDEDDSAFVLGEDVGKSGGIFQACRYLYRDFGPDRVIDTPIAENAILGSAVGAAMTGLKPIAEIMWADFIFVALDQIINQAANIRYITQGQSGAPMVVRTQQGVTPGSCAQHSQSIEAILCHIPGIKVATPATADDAYDILRAAAADPDPCVVIEARGLYPTKGLVKRTNGASAAKGARLVKEGSDAVIITWGTTLAKSLSAAEKLEAAGTSCAVLDLRWLNPLDEDKIAEVVASCNGTFVVAHEAVKTAGFGAEIFARIVETLGQGKEVKGVRVASSDVPMPSASALQQAILPSEDDIVSAVQSLLQ